MMNLKQRSKFQRDSVDHQELQGARCQQAFHPPAKPGSYSASAGRYFRQLLFITLPANQEIKDADEIGEADDSPFSCSCRRRDDKSRAILGALDRFRLNARWVAKQRSSARRYCASKQTCFEQHR